MTQRRPAPSPVLLVKSGGEEAVPEWRALFAGQLPWLDVRSWEDPTVDPAHVHYALVWQPEPGRLAGYPNLRLVLSSAAGVDHITSDPLWPRHVPLLRATTTESAQRMGEYVCMAALGLLKDLPRLVAQQRAARWLPFDTERCALDTHVGVLGLGSLGTHCARMLRGLGFRVSGWSRTPRELEGVACHAGPDGLARVLATSHILVCLLPATRETEGILCARTFAQLPRGAGLVHVGRGSHVVWPQLLAALDAGQLGGAVLDVFDREPLPPEDPLWRHGRVILTPHMAAIASRRARVAFFARQIEAQLRGEPLQGAYDPARGY